MGSKIALTSKREAEIQSCFNCAVKFHYLKNKNELGYVLEQIKLQSREVENDLSNDSYGDNIKTDCLIVMDNVSGLSEKSNKFVSFLTIVASIYFT